MTPTENDTDLSLSLPAMSAEIQPKQTGAKSNSKRRRNRRSKQNNKKKSTTSLDANGNQRKKGGSSVKSNELAFNEDILDAIPNSSDIMGGGASFDLGIEDETKSKREIEEINTKPKTKTQVAAPTRIIKNDSSATVSSKRIEISVNNGDNDSIRNTQQDGNIDKSKQQARSSPAVTSKKTTPFPRGRQKVVIGIGQTPASKSPR